MKINQLYTVQQIRLLEAAARNAGVTESQLMARAGEAVWRVLQERFGWVRRIVIVSGAGNNGGDGYVLAQFAHAAGLEVMVLTVGDHSQLSVVSQAAARQCREKAIRILPFESHLLSQADIIVDAIFGIGLARAVTGIDAQAIEAINAATAPVLSIDVPSGVCSDTGTVLGCAVCATVTVTFIGMKRGLLTGAAPNQTGSVLCDDLQLSSSVLQSVSTDLHALDLNELRLQLRPRLKASHKGHFGHVLVIGGDEGMSGAVRMAADAALYVGAGLVSVATRRVHSMLAARRPELLVQGVESARALKPLLERANVIVLGPGLGQSRWSRMMYRMAVVANKPMIVDADGLNLLAGHPLCRNNWILTPHPGEAARLLHTDVKTIEVNRFSTAIALQKKYGGVSVLKGAGSVIQTQTEAFLCMNGSPAMATGGMGDILSGVIAGLHAQGYSGAFSARLGVCLHACAGEMLAHSQGQRGLLATELLPAIRTLLNEESQT